MPDLATPAFSGQEPPAELDLIESRPLRDRNAGRTEILDKVKALALLPGNTFATVELVAAYYEVAPDAVESVIRDHRGEVEGDGLEVLAGPRLSALKAESGLASRAPSLTVIPRRAILRIGMLLRDSAVAKQVRTYLLDAEQPQFQIPQTFADALELAARQARQIENSAAVIAELEPAAAAWDTLASTGADYSAREAAYILRRDQAIDTGERKLLTKIREWRMVDHADRPYYDHRTHLVLRPQSYTDASGAERDAKPQIRITYAGLKYLHKRLGGTGRIQEHVNAALEAAEVNR